jgi:DNA modification methylase
MSVRLLTGDCRALLPTLAPGSVHCVVTSPPYWGLRDYGVEGQLGLEATTEEYVARMVEVFRAVRRVLRADGTLWLNMGDCYTTNFFSHDSIRSVPQPMGDWSKEGHRLAREDRTCRGAADGLGGLKPKDLVGMPWRLAFALQADGWFLRADIIWAKPNPMPESVTDRPTKAHEYIFLLTKSARYFYDADAVREPHDATSPFWRMHPNGQHAISRTARLDGTNEAAPNTWLRELSPGQGRNLRSVWTIPSAPYPEAHFATFPPALAQRCILAGTSAKGCCRACGAPWVRVISPSPEHAECRATFRMVRYPPQEIAHYLKTARMQKGLAAREIDAALGTVTLYSWYEGRPAGIQIPTAAHYRILKSLLGLDDRYDLLLENPALGIREGWKPQDDTLRRGLSGAGDHVATTPETRGWVPACQCDVPPVPCTVLDPFAGSGTVGEVAEQNGRDAILIELSPAYVRLAEARTAQYGLFTWQAPLAREST